MVWLILILGIVLMIYWPEIYQFLALKIQYEEDTEKKICLVVGAGSGLGKATAIEMATRGDYIFAADINEETIKELEKSHPNNISAVKLDVTSKASCLSAKEFIKQKLTSLEFGNNSKKGLDAVIGFAGVVIAGPFMELPYEEYAKVFNINLIGAMNVNRTFYSLCRGNEATSSYPKIITVLSDVAYARMSAPFTLYGASKIGLESYLYSLRSELSTRFGEPISEQPFEYTGYASVSGIYPGPFRTNMTKPGMFTHFKEQGGSSYGKQLDVADTINSGVLKVAQDASIVGARTYEIVHTKKPLRWYYINMSTQLKFVAWVPEVIREFGFAATLKAAGAPFKPSKQIF